MNVTPDNTLDYDRDTPWEKVAKTAWGSYITDVERRMILRAADLSGKPGLALEVGCEGGRWSRLLADRGFDMICTDINPRVLAICRARIPQAKCILVNKGDQTLPCKQESLKLLLCVEVPVVGEQDWFVSEAFRVLEDGGLIVGTFMNMLSFRAYFSHLLAAMRARHDCLYAVTWPSLKKKFCGQGFKMIYQEGICWFPFSRTSNSGSSG